MNAFLFDLDGTVIDSRHDIAMAANAARVAVGLSPLPHERVYGFIGEGAQRLIEQALGPEHAQRVPEALEAWRRHYGEHLLDTTKPYAGLPEVIATLPARCAIVTNKPAPFARRIIEGLGLAQHFPVVIGMGDVAARKPDPAMVRLALERLGAHDRVLLIGDTWIDAETAKNAGVGFVGVTWGLGRREQMVERGARLFAERVEELAEVCARALRDG